MEDPYYLFYVLLLSCCISNAVECIEDSDFLREFLSSDTTGSPDEIIQFWMRKGGTQNVAHEELIVKRSVGNVLLRMRRSSVLRYKTPIYLIREPDLIEKIDKDIISDVVALYEEPSLYSTVAHAVDELGHPYFIGNIAGRKIAPISNRKARSLQEEKPHLFVQTLKPGSVDESEKYIISNYYGLHTSRLPKNGTIVLPPLGSPDLFKKRDESHSKKPYKILKRSTASIVYPEILLVLNYDQKYTSIYEFQFLKLITYAITFWNSVNLRFRSLSDPEVRLRLTGIAVSMTRNALSFVRDENVSGFVDAGDIAAALRKWAHAHFPTLYDIPIIQTDLNLRMVTRDGKEHNIFGMAYSPATCDQDFPNWMVGVVHDKMDSSGVFTAVHELGHLLGASHDTADSPTICSNTKNYIMTDTGLESYNLEWSQCSREDISRMLKWSTGDCLDNENPISDHGDLISTELFLGAMLTLEKQCLLRNYDTVCEIQRGCTSLQCRNHSSVFCTDTGPALDGTDCPGGRCEVGKCVPITRKKRTTASNLWHEPV